MRDKNTSEEIEDTEEILPEEEGKSSHGGFARIFAVIAIVIIICFTGLYYGDSLGILRTEESGKISYAGYAKNSFACFNDGIAIASNHGIQVLNGEGELLLADKFEMNAPAVETRGDYAVFFDIGGKNVKVVKSSEIIFEPNENETVVSATINERGYTALCTQCDGYNGHMAVFEPDGTERFEWFSVEGYVLKAVVGPDSKTVAVLTLDEQGSNVVFFNITSDEELSRYSCGDEVLFDICFNSADEVSVISENRLTDISTEGKETASYDFGVRYLKTYDFGQSGTHTIVLSDYQAGGYCDIISVKNGKVKGSALEQPEIFRVETNEKRIAVLTTDRILIYNRFGKQKEELNSGSGVLDIMINGEGTVFAARQFSSDVYRINKGIFDLF